jgi:hypothetical protein
MLSRRVLAVVLAVLLFGAGVGVGLVVSDDGGGSDDTVAPREPPAAPRVSSPTVSFVETPVEEVPKGDPERGSRQGSPLDDLPANVKALTDFGQRPDWSPDGRSIVFLDGSPLGDVWTVDVTSGKTTNHTKDRAGRKFSRAYYLSNGDLLLCGPTSGPNPSADRPEAGRFTGVMSVLRAPFDDAPEPLGVPCWEGMATAATSMRIAWNRSDIDYTDSDLVDRVLNGITEVWTGEIRDVDGRAIVVHARKVLDRESFGRLAVFEVQDFRPTDERELILTAYAFHGGEVLGLDLETGKVRNYSNSSAYEEAESVSADGTAVFVERDLAYEGREPGALDIWRRELDTNRWQRVTHFNRYAPFYASNPAVSTDGRRLAFQLSIDGDTEGQGDGILLMDLERQPQD